MCVCFINCAVGFEAVQPAEDEAAADCTQANTLKAQLALTGNTSSPRCQSFLLGLGMCPWFDGNTITFSVELALEY